MLILEKMPAGKQNHLLNEKNNNLAVPNDLAPATKTVLVRLSKNLPLGRLQAQR